MNTQAFDWFALLKYLIPSGLIPSITFYLWAKYFRIRPRVEVSFKPGASSRSVRGSDRYMFTWISRIVYHNDSIYVARRFKMIASRGIDNWHFKSKLPDKLEKDVTIERQFEIEKTEHRDVLLSLFGEHALQQDQFVSEYLSHVLGDVTMIFSYDNEKDTTFYTKFTLANGTGSCRHSWRKPKL